MTKLIRYYPGKLIDYYASVPIGGKAVIVNRLKEQPTNRYYPILIMHGDCQIFQHDETGYIISIKIQFPIDSTVGMPETWAKWYERLLAKLEYKYRSDYTEEDNKFLKTQGITWRSPATMPSSAIRPLFEVTETRVCEVKYINLQEMIDTGVIHKFHTTWGFQEREFKNWYLARYPDGSWEDWVEVTTVRRIEK